MHNPHVVFFSRNKKYIYVIIWITFLANTVKSLSHDNFLLVFGEMGQVGQVGYGISRALSYSLNTYSLYMYLHCFYPALILYLDNVLPLE